jgi:type II restriction/modification system DNA methylase subunit YeeA
MAINLKEIEEKIKPLGGQPNYDKGFIFDLLTAFGRSSGNITRLRNGQLNIANDKSTEVAQKNIVYFKPTRDNLYSVIDDLKNDSTVVRYNTRFVIVTDYEKFLSIDTKTNETLDIPIKDINKHFAFFLPWAGMEKAQFVGENHADVKAAEKMAKLFDEIVACNEVGDAAYYHSLNVFFTRLLFCFFAEDTDIFNKSQFTDAIGTFTQLDGSDLQHFLRDLFASLDDEDKSGYPAYLAAFPYVNGHLFGTVTQVPQFSKKARELLIECGGRLDWSDINPDIFGSMIQAVVNPGQRAGLGMHYTSVPNIMKTIEPLFLKDLRDDLNSNFNDSNKLEKLLQRISAIKIFDPACGSGNFLVIAYKELRKLEHVILERQEQFGDKTTKLFSRVNIENFFGIEIDDFAHEVAVLSLWLAKHQMNIEFREKFGVDIPLIPLKESGNIVLNNSARIDWNKVCKNNGIDEIYLIGNPPYLGSSLQDPIQKKDMTTNLSGFQNYKNLDYVAIWFKAGVDYIRNSNAQISFVSTNSICQGEQVALLWPYILSKGLEIGYAYTSFKWSNGARNNAGVTCVIINLRNKIKKPKYIHIDNMVSSYHFSEHIVFS